MANGVAMTDTPNTGVGVAALAQDDAFIHVDNLRAGYGDAPAVDRVSFSVRQGSFVALIGPSGCGKSTILQTLSGLHAPAGGSVSIGGTDLYGVDEPARIGYVFQDHRLLPWRTVGQNITIALQATGVPKSEWDQRVETYLDMLDILPFRQTFPMRMSGGQRQRASIARALAIDPSVVLMDEPFSTLDELTARSMRSKLLDVWKASGRTFLFVTHSIREAVFLADRIIVLSRGPARVLQDRAVEVARPRSYEDPALAELETQLVAEVMDAWETVPNGVSSPSPTETGVRA